MSRLHVLILALVTLLTISGCSRADSDDTAASPGDAAATAPEVRLGYFPNLTHAPALIGAEAGLFTAELGATKLATQNFNAGGEAVAALLGGSLDVTYIGSGPAINAFAKSNGEAVRLIAGATQGGAQLVVRPDITGIEQLRGTTLATPQAGNTQDIALKTWLPANGLSIGRRPDQVQITNLDNPRTFDAFREGSVDGGWLPEPWSSRLALDAGARVLLDERALWPDGNFPTTVLLVRTEFLEQYPGTVRALLRGHLAALDLAATDETRAKTLVNQGLEKLTGNQLAAPVLDRAFENITLSPDPLAATFPRLAQDSVTAAITDKLTDLAGLVDVGPLNTELAAARRPAVDATGLDKPGGTS
ncbi:MAG: ABC transporter substrate-binding protein [Pseudonocardia sp.]